MVRRRRPTIRDVAAHAGVSFKSVSNVVNDHPYVSEDLRRKVQESIAALGYRPHAIARSLASRRTNALGIVLRAAASDGYADPFFAEFLLGVCAVAGREGFGVLVHILPGDNAIPSYAHVFDHRQVDGLIDFSPRIDDAPTLEADDGHEFPAVRIGRAIAGSDGLAVDGDNVQGARAAITHLIALGHRRVGMVSNAHLAYTVALTRVQGYREALAAHDLPFEEDLLVVGSFSRQSGYDAMLKLLDVPRPPSAVFVSSDRMALGAMRAADARGLRIPEDMALIGFDDLYVAEHTCPPLTTVQTPIDAISAHATHMLIDAIRGLRVAPRQAILPTTLMVRQSCGARSSMVAGMPR